MPASRRCTCSALRPRGVLVWLWAFDGVPRVRPIEARPIEIEAVEAELPPLATPPSSQGLFSTDQEAASLSVLDFRLRVTRSSYIRRDHDQHEADTAMVVDYYVADQARTAMLVTIYP
jgi:hypothetical protein